MHRTTKPHVQAKKVPPPAIPGDSLQQKQQQAKIQKQQQQQQHIPLYHLGGSINNAVATVNNKKYQIDDVNVGGVGSGNGNGSNGIIIMSSLVTSPSLEEGGFNLPRETSVALRMKDEIDYQTTSTASSATAVAAAPMSNTTPSIQTVGVGVGVASAAASSSTSAVNTIKSLPTASANPLLSVVPCPVTVPAFCATLREPLTHKAAVYYHQQLALQEDQGIDLTQSPGRDSPGSSSGSAGSGSRHSTASLDSGRASSYLTGVSGAGSIRGSSGGGSSAGGGALSSPRCSSVSSCSIGSVDRQRNDELIIDWLIEMKCEEYAQLFIAAGYDLPTIARMTPEDLTAIGIKSPHHRERIKQRIDKLQVLDNLPHFVPGSIEEWLQLLRLEEYIQPLLDQNYKTVRDVTQVTWEDLEDIGIVKLGHQKKILLAIKRVKDIISGKWNPGGINAYHQQNFTKIVPLSPLAVAMPTTPPYLPTTAAVTAAALRVSSWDDSKTYANTNGEAAAYYCTGSNHECCSGNDVVLIKVRQPRGKSLESLEDIHDNSTRSHLTFSHYTTTDYGHFGHPTTQQHHQLLQQQQLHHLQQQQQQQAALMSGQRLLSNPAAMSWRRSYDDGDITPTNDATRELMYEEGGGTLPRQQRGILQRAVLNTMPPIEHHHYMNAAAAAGLGGAGGGVGATSGGGSGLLIDTAGLGASYLTGSPMSNKKIAPEPPRRHCSIRNSRTLSSDANSIQLHHQQQQQSQQQQQQQGLHNVAAAALYYGGGGGVGTTGGGGVVVGGGGGILPAMHAHSHSYMTQQQQQQPIYANYATIQQTTAEIHCEKFHDNKSNSSIDSIDTIPFANENTGTIKQRLLNRQDMNAQTAAQQHGTAQQQQQLAHNLHSSSSSSSSSSTNTIANITHSFHSLKSSASLHDASLIRSDSSGSNTSGGSAGAPVQMCSSSMVHLRSPTLQYPTIIDGGINSGIGSGGGTITTTVDLHAPSSGGHCNSSLSSSPDASAIAGASTASNATTVAVAAATVTATNAPKVSVNVLNDIGNMLANLTDELDAMLEEEKRAGLNIDSE